MLYYDIIDLSERIDSGRSNNSKVCMFYHHSFFNNELKCQDSVCNGCHNLMMLCLNLSDIAVTTVKGVDYCWIIHDISKSEAIHLLENSVLDDRGYI